MTREQIEQLTGRELDAEVARRVFGREVRLDADGTWVVLEGDTLHPLPYYSTDIAAAFEVVEEMERQGFSLQLYCESGVITGDRRPRWYAHFGHDCQEAFDEVGGAIAPAVICKAALLALSVLFAPFAVCSDRWRFSEGHIYNRQMPDRKYVINLFANEPTLIVPHPTGVYYQTQAGGMACLHPAVEGFVVPLNWYRQSADCPIADCSGCAGRFLTDEEADSLDTALKDAKLPLRVSRESIRHSTEAWVYVNVLSDADKDLAPFAGREVILTWQNCD